MDRINEGDMADDEPLRLSAQQFRDATESLGLSQPQAARFLDVADRTARRWADDTQEIPGSITLLLALMLHFHLSPEQAEAIARDIFGET